MKIDFTKVSDEEVTYELLSEGKHLLKVVSCEKKMTKNGNEMFAIKYEDKDGNAVYDNLVFTEKTLNRVKKCFSNLGLDINGEFDYQPEDLIGCYMNAEIKIEDYEYNGKKGQRNTIDLWNSEKFAKAGVKKVAKKAEPEVDVESELPF